MRAKCPFGFVVAIAVVTLGSFVTVAAQESGVGELVPQIDPNEAPFAVMWGSRVPGPMVKELPEPPTVLSQAPDSGVFDPAGSAASFDPVGSFRSGIPVTRGAGAGISDFQEARRSLKQLIRQLG